MKICAFLFLLGIFINSLYALDVIQGSPPNSEIVRRVQEYLSQDPVVVEAGTYDGKDTAQLSALLPSAYIFTFEPVPELFQKSSANLSAFPNIKIFNLALSNTTGQATMYLSEKKSKPGQVSQSSSLLKPADHLIYAPLIEFNCETIVSTTTLDDWARHNDIKKIDLLKLDIQGNELDVMMASPDIFQSVKAILTEVEFTEAYKGQYQFEQINAWLEEQGFELDCLFINCQWFGSQDVHAPWFGDALFIRKSSSKRVHKSSPVVTDRINMLISEIKISPPNFVGDSK